MRSRFDEIDGFTRIYDGSRYLVLFGHLWYDVIYNRIRYLASEKSAITSSINHDFARIWIDSCNFLPIEKILTFHFVIILIKSLVNKNENNYYYFVFLEKGFYRDKFNTQSFYMNVCILSMLCFDRIDVSEEVDINKTSAPKECNICHYWHFLNKGFKFQPNVCNSCHDLLMMSLRLSVIVF